MHAQAILRCNERDIAGIGRTVDFMMFPGERHECGKFRTVFRRDAAPREGAEHEIQVARIGQVQNVWLQPLGACEQRRCGPASAA
jgi:hypothetical protein